MSSREGGGVVREIRRVHGHRVGGRRNVSSGREGGCQEETRRGVSNARCQGEASEGILHLQ